MARQRGTTWQADVTIDGARKRVSFKTREEAEAYENAVSQGLPAPQAVTFGAFIDQYFDHLWGNTKRPDTSRISCNVLLRFIPRDTLLKDISTSLVVSAIARMRGEGMANGTINRKLSALSKIIKLADRMELITKRPAIDFQQEGKGRERVLSKDEEIRALLYLDHVGLTGSKALVQFLLYTGCRLGEAYKVRRADVRDGRVTFRDTKNGSTRTVPLVGPAAEAWATVSKLSGADVPFEVIPRDTFRGHWRLLRSHLNATDDECFVPHMLRHTCATRLVVHGVPLPQVMKWMGHRNIQTTMRYSHLCPKDLDVAAQALLEAA